MENREEGKRSAFSFPYSLLAIRHSPGSEDASMKLVSYLAGGKPSFGVVVGDGVVTMNDRLNVRYATLRDVIAAGALEELSRGAQGAAPDQKLAGLQYLPVIPNPEKIMCVGINYKSHAAE